MSSNTKYALHITKIKQGVPLLLAVAVFVLLNYKWGGVPAMGRFLSPFTGFWQNGESPLEEREMSLLLPGLKEGVTVLYDDNHVPHIFAENDHDLYFAQGYITASDRLWQMEFQTRAAAGRISEVVGPVALEYDRYQRRMGTVYGAQRSLEEMEQNPESKAVLEAYSAGINAYIGQLQPRDYPFEYKLLDYAPESWTLLKCALLLKQMTHTLNGGSYDLMMSRVLQEYGKKLTENLFPDRPFLSDPVIPAGTSWDFEPLQIPRPDVSDTGSSAAGSAGVTHPAPEEGTGSNNWVLSGSRTASGAPILANDPHLDLSLPSIWYQIQLHAPGINACGASLPGAPGIISGFNERTAWGVTNVGSDVLDFYSIKFQDKTKKTYLLDDKWVPVREEIEHIKVRGQKDFTDTVRYTRFGPVVYEPDMDPFKKEIPAGYAVKWIAHYGGDEIRTFYLLNRASDYDDYVNALRYYAAPAQNFAFASAEGDIAMWVNGKFPLKWPEQGKFLLDGSRSSNDWQGWIPHEQNPHVKNPPRGYISSANQFSTDDSYPYYLDWSFSLPDRASRINELLEGMQQATPDSIRLMQSDSYKKLAVWALPSMLQHLDSSKLAGNSLEACQALRNWDYENRGDAIAPSIFESWWDTLEYHLWNDEFPADGDTPMLYPRYDRTIHLLREEPDAPWFDNVHTPEQEDIRQIMSGSFLATVEGLEEKYGDTGPAWEWGKVKGTYVPHILNQPGLNSEPLLMGGGKGTINALSTKKGPSWRMVVELTQPVKAYGIYPGGQSGHPGSPYYDNMIPKWQKGELNELLFLPSPDEKNPAIVTKITLRKE